MKNDNPVIRRALAWGVHLYTATGLIAAAGMVVALVRGGDASIRICFILMFIATAIDTTDGSLARLVDVKRYTPGFDGRRLDDLIDFHTYTTLPLFLIWRAELLPPGTGGLLLVPLLASAYGFSQVGAKTNDHYFLGFPSYWNVVAFYLYLLQLPGWIAAGVLLTLAVLTFVPSLYLYTTHGGRLSLSTNILGVLWAAQVLWITLRWHEASRSTVWLSLAFPVYYFVCSWGITLNFWRERRRAWQPTQVEGDKVPVCQPED